MTRYAEFDDLAKQVDNLDAVKYKDRIDDLLDICSEAIDTICNRPDGFIAASTATARTFVGSGHNVQKINECVEISLVEVKRSINDSTWVSWASTDWLAFRGSHKRPNFNPLAKNNPMPYTSLMIALTGNQSHFTSGYTYLTREGFPPAQIFPETGQPTVRVTAKWGYAVSVPLAIKQATIIQATQFFKRGQGVWADALANGDFQELRFVKETDPAYNFLTRHKYVMPQIG